MTRQHRLSRMEQAVVQKELRKRVPEDTAHFMMLLLVYTARKHYPVLQLLTCEIRINRPPHNVRLR